MQLQTNLQIFKMDNKHLISIYKRYEGDRIKQHRYLQLMRPHPGALAIGQGDDPPSTDDERLNLHHARKIDTRAIDVLIVVLRMLIAYGYDMTVPKDPKKFPLIIRAFYDSATLDLGWNPTLDMLGKAKLLALIQHSANEYTMEELKGLKPLTYHAISKPFFYDKDFQFYDEKIVASNRRWENGGNLHCIEWDGQQTLNECIEESFAYPGHSGTYAPIMFPPFMRIRYQSHQSPRRKFAEIREVNFTGFHMQRNYPEDEEIVLERKPAMYNLRIVVRIGNTDLEDGNGHGSAHRYKDDVRTYWADGYEIVPPEVGNFAEKDAEADVPANERWSVENNGTFDLFYFRVLYRDETNITSQINPFAPEFSVRPWATSSRDIAHQDPHVTATEARTEYMSSQRSAPGMTTQTSSAPEIRVRTPSPPERSSQPHVPEIGETPEASVRKLSQRVQKSHPTNRTVVGTVLPSRDSYDSRQEHARMVEDKEVPARDIEHLVENPSDKSRRGRGRPEAENNAMGGDATEMSEIPPKEMRGRGRPKTQKRAIDDELYQLSQNPPKEARKRGRPPGSSKRSKHV
jgi:hypothetical protein